MNSECTSVSEIISNVTNSTWRGFETNAPAANGNAELAEPPLINQTVLKTHWERFELIEMRNQNKIKKLKLVVIILAAVPGFLAQSLAGAQDQPARLFEIAGMTMPLEQRVGVDDGAEFVVHFAGDARGTLDTCG